MLDGADNGLALEKELAVNDRICPVSVPHELAVNDRILLGVPHVVIVIMVYLFVRAVSDRRCLFPMSIACVRSFITYVGVMN